MVMSRKAGYLIILLTLGMSLVLQLTGCQLAKKDGALNRKTENLCGVFVTTGPRSTSLNEQALENMDFTASNNKAVTFDEEDWASLYMRTVEGAVSANSSIKFEGADGYFMGLIQSKNKSDQTDSTFVTDSEFHDIKVHVNLTDKGEEKSYETTLSIGTGFHEIVYMNPVYQRRDGTYYTTIGQAMGSLISDQSLGNLYSSTLDNTIANTENSITHFDKITFKVNIAVVDEPKQIFIKEMNPNDELIKNTEYLLSFPEEFVVDRSTEYVIVEEVINRVPDGDYVKRSIYSLGQKDLANELICHLLNFPGENKILNSRSIQFVR